MRRLLPLSLLAALTATVALAAVPAAAPAYRVGFSEQQSHMFENPLFRDLNVRYARLIIPYDAVLRRTGDVANIDLWLERARAARVRPLIAFNASRGCYENSRIPNRASCRLPSVRRYTQAIRAFRNRYPSVREYQPWNEANHQSQPTDKKPRRAAEFYNALKANCRGCTITAADVLDEGDVDKWLRTFRRYVRGNPRLWGAHNYSDTNRMRNRGTRKILRAVPGQVWLTETGGVVRFGSSFPYDEQRAARALSYMFRLAESSRRIARLYIYQWTGAEPGARFDAGIIGPDGQPRPGYQVVRDELRG